MQRAQEIRGQRPNTGASTPIRRSLLRDLVDGVSRESKEVKVQYSKTKVARTDPEVLRKNKIFSLFKEHRVTDEVEALRTQILAKLNKIGGNTILVTSAHPGEGKTFTSINLGVSIAQQLDRTVLIVDCDLRSPWKNHFDLSHDFFGLNINMGLADYLLGNAAIEDVFVNPGIEKLTILPGGKPLSNSSELLGSKRMEELVIDLKNRYRNDRIVIFDSPAMLACTDPLVFSHLIDGVIIVVQAERTSPDDIRRVVDLLQDRPILGTVLNKSKEPRETYV